SVQGQPDPVQPDRPVRRLVAPRDRRVQVGARPRRAARDCAADPRARHRRRLRPACRVTGRVDSAAMPEQWFDELSELIAIPSVSADAERKPDVAPAPPWLPPSLTP